MFCKKIELTGHSKLLTGKIGCESKVNFVKPEYKITYIGTKGQADGNVVANTSVIIRWSSPYTITEKTSLTHYVKLFLVNENDDSELIGRFPDTGEVEWFIPAKMNNTYFRIVIVLDD